MTALQPLYVDSTAAGISLEGPALVVARPARAATRVPLRRLARVVVRGAVPFATDALLGCLGAGVPVTFVGLDGQVLGYCIARERRAWSLDQLLDRLMADPGWPEPIGRWARHAESEAIRHACRRMRVQPDLDTRPTTVRVLLAAVLPGGPTPGAEAVLRRLDGLLRAHLAEMLQRAGIPARFRGQDGTALDLRPYLTQALGWHLWPVAAGVLEYRQRHPARPTTPGMTGDRTDDRRRRLAVAYEAATPMIAASFRRALAELDALLRESLS
jgi:hypothetical protein